MAAKAGLFGFTAHEDGIRLIECGGLDKEM